VGSTGPTGLTGPTGAQGALSDWIKKTANYTASNNERIIADTTGGTFTITLPALPTTGYYVQITDGGNFATTPLTVGRNGSTFEGYADDLSLTIAGTTYEFIYSGATWQVTATTGAQGPTGPSGGGSGGGITTGKAIAMAIVFGG
jgi:hypothetical protein